MLIVIKAVYPIASPIGRGVWVPAQGRDDTEWSVLPTANFPARRAPAGPDARRWHGRRVASPRQRRWWHHNRRPVAADGGRPLEGRNVLSADADAARRGR